MRVLETSAYELAERWVGTKELPGGESNPFILGMLRLDSSWPAEDAVPWCSAFANYIAWQLRLPRSKSLAARSWLMVGTPVERLEAEPGFDVVVLKRGEPAPGPDVLTAPGHVGFYGGREDNYVLVLGGNQGDAVSLARFPASKILGIRRLA